MKKFLSLVLALVMTMSLVTVSAGAKQTFTDDDAIDYTEAVEVVKACKIIDGYADGSFNPTATLTRGAAAKIICNLILGPTTASALSADAAPYKDVPANSTFAGYIAYCAKEGIVSGYADGTFKPGATLTGYAFWKMLLGALGYDANIEGYVGSNWSISVAKRGLSDDVDLADGLSGDFDGQKAVTRQEACLYVFNALQAKVASYGNTTTVTVGGTDVTVGGSKVQFVNGTFMANYFKKLAKSTTTDDAGRPATQWTYDDKEVGTYAKTPKAVFTSNEKMYKLRDAIGKLTSNDTVSFYYSVNNAAGTMDSAVAGINRKVSVGKYTSTSTTKLSALADPLGSYVGNGVFVEVYYSKSNPAQTKIVVVDEFIGKITAVKSDDEGRYVRVNGKDFHTEDFKVGDWVLYTVEGGSIASMAAAEKLTATLTKTDGDKLIMDNGSTYELHKGVTMSDKTIGNTYDFYLDSNGYIIKISLASASVAAENLVLVTSKTTVGFDTQAKVIYGTGKTDTVTLKNDADTNKVYKFTTDGGKLKTSSNSDYITNYYGTLLTGNYYFVKGATAITDKDNGNYVAAKVNNKTTFVVVDSTDFTKTTVYNGYASAAQFEGAKAIVSYGKAGEAAVLVYVFVAPSNVTNASNKATYVLTKLGDLQTEKNAAGDVIEYYNVKTVDGETLKVEKGSSAAYAIAAAKNSDEGVYVIDSKNTNSNGLITTATRSSKANSVGALNLNGSTDVVKVEDGVLVIGSASYSMTSDIKVSIVNKSCDTIEAGDIDALDESQGAYTGAVVVVNNTTDNQVAELYLTLA